MGDITKVCSVKDPKGSKWEFECEGKICLKSIYISYSSHSIDFLQFVGVRRREGLSDIVHSSGKYGRQAGNKFKAIELSPSEYITSVTGNHFFDQSNGRYGLTSITFITNQHSYGPFGCLDLKGNEEFNFNVGRAFGGFYGTLLDGKLESVGVLVKTDY